MRRFDNCARRWLAGGGWLLALAGGAPVVAQTGAALPSEFSPALTALAQLRAPVFAQDTGTHAIRLEGTVLWAKPAQGRLVLQDPSGTAELEMNFADSLPPGQRVRVTGRGTVTRAGAGWRLGVNGPLVDNDGVHRMLEKSGTLYLQEGLHPIRLDWFNALDKAGLEIEYAGAALARQRISSSALFRASPDPQNRATNFVNGLDYRCFEGAWNVVPKFDQLTPVNTGTAAGFDLEVRSRAENVGVQFAGFLRVERAGDYTFYLRSDDGSRLFVGEPAIRLEDIGRAPLPAPRWIAIGQVLGAGEDGHWAELEGTVTLVREQGDELQLELSAGAGRLRVEFGEGRDVSGTTLLNRRVRLTGFCQSATTPDGQQVPGVLLVPGREQLELLPSAVEQISPGGSTHPAALSVLTTAAEVHRLKREEAQRGHPVRLRGVITSVMPEHQAFTVQDATRGLYVVDISPAGAGLPCVGEFVEIEGATDPGLFAPCVNARAVKTLGAGQLPEPIRPTLDQLINGSLDAQYVEVPGIITALQSNGVTLLTREGSINVELRLAGRPPGALARQENALVRVRGCLFAAWDYLTHQVKLGEIRIYDADVLVDQPAPADLFSTPQKSAAELLLFDPQAGVLQRVKVAGQIVHVRDPEYFMMDGRRGVRFLVRRPADLRVGDTVEVVGFPEFSRAFSMLREAVVRPTGQAPLPPASYLTGEDLGRAEHDATLVAVEGTLVGLRQARDATLLEMQSGLRAFVARLGAAKAADLSLPIGSKLALTGVYAAQGGSRVAAQEIASFELLLNSARDLQVLARPRWWTLERLLITVGVLVGGLAISLLWITQLHRRVEQRTAELESQIRERQRAEHQRLMEQERARVAQDLHDELGSGLTEVSMLMARARAVSAPDEKRGRYLDQVGEKAREMVIALDEIVWAMNPRHDSLASLVSYFSLYADRFLGLANIAWRLEETSEPRDHAVDSRYRHQLFLAFKEALTNVVRHSGATEVRLAIRLDAGQVRLTIADNGRGLPRGARTDEMNGVDNMRARLEKLGGDFSVSSEPGRGTTLSFAVPAQ